MQKNKPIAIHYREDGFTPRFIEYLQQNSIPYKLVNCYDNDIIKQLKDCAGLIWHWSHTDYRDKILAKQLLTLMADENFKIFPDYWNNIVFDDKVAQKYLLEKIDAPLVPTYIFYSKNEALKWIDKTTFPKVFKLSGGGGSLNVRLIKNKKQARRIVKRAFGKGFHSVNVYSGLKQRFWVFKRDKSINNIIHVIKGLIRILFPKSRTDLLPKQKGYVYFQEFLTNNNFDIRLIIIGNRCFGLRRFNRKNDFKASGSGLIDYDQDKISTEAIKIAFNTSKELKSKSLALDFIFDDKNEPKIVEISYAFPTGEFTDECTGYWDEELNWHEGKQNLQYLIMEDFVKELT